VIALKHVNLTTPPFTNLLRRSYEQVDQGRRPSFHLHHTASVQLERAPLSGQALQRAEYLSTQRDLLLRLHAADDLLGLSDQAVYLLIGQPSATLHLDLTDEGCQAVNRHTREVVFKGVLSHRQLGNQMCLYLPRHLEAGSGDDESLDRIEYHIHHGTSYGRGRCGRASHYKNVMGTTGLWAKEHPALIDRVEAKVRNRLDVKDDATLLWITVIKGHEQRSQMGVSGADDGVHKKPQKL
jgi:hypothetical protein